MTPFRLPESHLPMFKAGKLLLGRKLYNSFSKTMGHKDFNALMFDSKEYGAGTFNSSEFLSRILLVKLPLNIPRSDFVLSTYKAFKEMQFRYKFLNINDLEIQQIVNKSLSSLKIKVLGKSPFKQDQKVLSPIEVDISFSNIMERLKRIMTIDYKPSPQGYRDYELFRDTMRARFQSVLATDKAETISQFLYLTSNIIDEMEYTHDLAEDSLAMQEYIMWEERRAEPQIH